MNLSFILIHFSGPSCGVPCGGGVAGMEADTQCGGGRHGGGHH